MILPMYMTFFFLIHLGNWPFLSLIQCGARKPKSSAKSCLLRGSVSLEGTQPLPNLLRGEGRQGVATEQELKVN